MKLSRALPLGHKEDEARTILTVYKVVMKRTEVKMSSCEAVDMMIKQHNVNNWIKE